MKSYTCKFEGAYGVIHELVVMLNHDSIFSDELFKLVKEAFFESKSILENAIYSFPNSKSSEIFPEKKLVEKILYCNSNGKYKNLISDYEVSRLFDSSVKICIKLNTFDYSNMTGSQVSSIAYMNLREPLWWEDYGKKFYSVSANPELIRNYLKEKKILKCYYYDKPYYFNIGIDELNVTDYMIEEAIWFVYE